MNDPYRVLNLPRDADPAAIKRAYRALAKRLHPDRNPGNPEAERRFKDITQAYQVLSDPKKRARFDRGEIDAEGHRRAPFGFGGTAEGVRRGPFEGVFERVFSAGFGRGFATGNADVDEILRARAKGGAGVRQRGADRHHRLEIDFLTAVRGGKARLSLPDGRSLEVEVPAGAEDGKVLRLRRQGDAGAFGGVAGDALVELAIRAHPHFARRRDDIHLELPISVAEALFGVALTVPTIDGPVRMTVPAGSNTGRTLRLKGKGVARANGARGDQLVRLMVVLPERPDAALERWAREHGYQVRRDLGQA